MAWVEQQVFLEKIQQAVDAAGGKQESAPARRQLVDTMRQSQDNVFNRPVVSGIPVVGGLVVIAKKIIRRLIAWYTNPFAQQQTQFNQAAYTCTNSLMNRVDELEKQNQLLYAQLQALQAQDAANNKEV